MVRRVVTAYLEALSSLLEAAGPALLVALGILGVLLVAGLVLYAQDRDGFGRARDWLAGRLGRAAAWGLAALVLGLTLVGLGVVRDGVINRALEQDSARYSSAADPAGGETFQAGPAATVLGQRTYTRTLTLPPEILSRLGAEGAEVLAPYLGGVGGEVLALRDSFRRSGRQVVFVREVTLRTETPVPLDASAVKAVLRFDRVVGGSSSGYTAAFAATYRFTNPLPRAARVRFSFPLPQGSGTLSEFELRANGEVVPQPDEDERYLWEGRLAAGGTATVTVRYRHRGARAWRYDLGYRREPIRSFKLVVDADRTAKFLRGSLYPTTQVGGRLSWDLRNVITAQSVALSYPGVSLRETLTRLYGFGPLALLFFSAWTLAWGWRRGLPLRPAGAMLAVLGFGFGLALSSYLLAYLGPLPAGLIGALASALLAAVALGPAYRLPAVVSALSPLAFLWVGNAGLLLALAGGGALVSLLPGLWPSPGRTFRRS